MARQTGARRPTGRGARSGFTLLEILVATTIFTLILLVSLSIFGQALSVWKKSSGDIRSFQSARLAYEIIGRSLGQATLNTYLDYLDGANLFASDPGYSPPPTRYGRRSDLQFVAGLAGQGGIPGTQGTGTGVFFAHPKGFGGSGAASGYTGLNQLLNICGFYITFGPDSYRPSYVTSPQRYRYRLMQMLVPTQDTDIFETSDEGAFTWFSAYAAGESYVVAENIIALVVVPVDPAESIDFLTSNFSYDSRKQERANPQPITANQLPPVMQVAMVAIDEVSAIRLEDGSAEPTVIRDALDSFATALAVGVSNYEEALSELEDDLTAAKINFRVFSSQISIKESKWTKK